MKSQKIGKKKTAFLYKIAVFLTLSLFMLILLCLKNKRKNSVYYEKYPYFHVKPIIMCLIENHEKPEAVAADAGYKTPAIAQYLFENDMTPLYHILDLALRMDI